MLVDSQDRWAHGAWEEIPRSLPLGQMLLDFATYRRSNGIKNIVSFSLAALNTCNFQSFKYGILVQIKNSLLEI